MITVKFGSVLGTLLALGVATASVDAAFAQEEEEPIQMRPSDVDTQMMGNPTGPGDDVTRLPSPSDPVVSGPAVSGRGAVKVLTPPQEQPAGAVRNGAARIGKTPIGPTVAPRVRQLKQ